MGMRRGRHPRAVAALAALALGASALAACAPVVDPDWTAPGWPEASDLRLVAAPQPLDVSADRRLAASLTPLRIRNEEVALEASAAIAPGAPGLTDAILPIVREAISAAEVATGATYVPQVRPVGADDADSASGPNDAGSSPDAENTSEGNADSAAAGNTAGTTAATDPARDPAGASDDPPCRPGSTYAPAADVLAGVSIEIAGGVMSTAVVCDVVAASGTFLGQRIRVVAGSADAIASDVTSTIYADLATGEAVNAADLWLPDAAEQLRADIVDGLRRDAGALSLRPVGPGDESQVAAVRTALASAVLQDDGVAVTIAAGFSAPELAALGVAATTEPITVLLPPAAAEPLLSPFGVRMLAARGTSWAGAEAVGVGWVDCALLPCVALTYDDGPSSRTAPILDALAARDSVATFFPLGSEVAGYRDALARMTAEGHEVGTHSWNHPSLPSLTPEQVATQIRDSARVIADASGQPVRAFRPPYGEYNAETLDAARLPAILWDIDPRDWQSPADEYLVEQSVDFPTPGSIVLLHDVHAVTERATPAIIDGLLDRGFFLVTVSQLFGGELPERGAWRRGP